MGRDSLANRLAVKRKAGFLKSFGKRIDSLRREKERLERALVDPDALGNEPWIESVERTVQGFIGAGPVYGIKPVSDWANRSIERIQSIKQSGTPPTEDDVNWITSITQELVVLHSEALGEIQDDLTPEELEANPLRISMLPLGAFPSAKRLSTIPPTAAVNETAEEDRPALDDSGTLPPDPIDSAAAQDRDIAQDEEIVAAAEPGTLASTAAVSGYAPPPEHESLAPGVGPTVTVAASEPENAERTIPLAFEDLSQVRNFGHGDKPVPLVPADGLAEKPTRGWRLLALGLFIALLVSLYFNWSGYSSGITAPSESISDTEVSLGESTTAFSADTQARPETGSASPNPAIKSPQKDDPTAAKAPPKVAKEKKRRTKSRSKARSKSRRSRTKKKRAPDAVEPTPSKNAGVLSILAPSRSRGPVSITVDKRVRGNAPVKLKLSAGLHEVVQTYKGRKTVRIVLIQKGRTKTITAKAR